MKPARIFQQYIWLVTLLMRYKRLTLEEISQRWIDDARVGAFVTISPRSGERGLIYC